MKTNCVITIGRQFGSGGRYVGRMLAEKLGIPFYDKELLSEAAKQSGICEEIFEDHDEKPTRSLLFNLVTGMQVHGDAGSYYMDMPLNHKIFLAQFDAIRSIADKGPCVIVGRCADYVLKDRPNTISVFLKAEMQSKVERAVKYYGVDPQKAEDRIRKADKQRASYYNYYATATWGDMNNYDLCVLSTHGAYYTYEYGWLWKRTATAPVLLLTEKSTFWNDLRYGMDLLNHRIIKVNGAYAVTAGFFRAAYRSGALKDTIILSETCEFYGKSGHLDTSMADALLSGGAACVVGYVNNVYTVYSRSMLWATVNRLLAGDTVREAVDFGLNLYGADDIIWYNEQGGRRPHAAASYAMLSGDRSAALPNPYTAEEAATAA